MTITVCRLSADDPRFQGAAALFDAYRQHYGANSAPAEVDRWLRAQARTDRLRVFAATGDGGGGRGDGAEGGGSGGVANPGGGEVAVGLRGLLTVAVVPASMTLRTAWLIRDVYVDPGARRLGVARAMLAYVTASARAEGAHRLSMQTEPGNTGALSLYAAAGFEPVTDLALLNLTL